MKKPHFIQKAIKHPGALTAQAKAKGLTPTQLCAQGNLSSTTQKRCNLMKTLKGFKKG